ncbi:MAG: Rieske 2Fe-2S domain-containing protein [Chloroflexi bacterium]|nr:Rieske 2Fe-2S domain-containing protein [Chloroflexota bacterium]
MLTKDQNDLICRTGPGTPGGDWFRRYWQPIAMSNDINPDGQPKGIRILSEDLVLFRDDQGRPGLVGLHCSHRLTSLAYGRVEDGGIRCPFHGWLYDVEGRCLDQPAEPEGSTFKDRVKHLAYPCQELGGLIFTYMGPPDQQPLLPRYEVLVREDGTRWQSWYTIDSNYLQNVEGALDTVHFAYLHQNNWSKVKAKLRAMPKPALEWKEREYGIWQKSILPNVQAGLCFTMYSYFFFPAGFLRVQEETAGVGGVKKYLSWYVPIDDEHCIRWQTAFAPSEEFQEPYSWPPDGENVHPRAKDDYGRDYYDADSIPGILPVGATFRSEDTMVNESQGPIAERWHERLGEQDHVLMAQRLMMIKAVKDVQAGKDPKHIFRDPEQNQIVYIRGMEEMELV